MKEDKPFPLRSLERRRVGLALRDTLTATEEQVAEAVSQGLTNRQVAKLLFMSHHTVDAHLRRIYWKFGINSRSQLTRLQVERAYDLKATA